MLFLRILSNLSGLLPIYAGRNVRNVLWYYCWASLITDIICLLLKRQSLPFQWLMNVFSVAEFLLVGLFLHQMIVKPRFWLVNGVVLFAVLAIFFVATIRKSVLVANMEGVAMIYVYFIVMLLLGFIKILKEIEHVHLRDSPFFFFCIGFLIYSTGTFAVYLFQSYVLSHQPGLIANLWIVPLILNLVKHGFIAYYFILKNSGK